MRCPHCDKNIRSRAAQMIAADKSKAILDRKSEEFRNMFSMAITKLKLSDYNEVYTFLSNVDDLREEWVTMQINKFYGQYKSKAKPLSYLWAIMNGRTNK